MLHGSLLHRRNLWPPHPVKDHFHFVLETTTNILLSSTPKQNLTIFSPKGKTGSFAIIILNENLFTMRGVPVGWKRWRFYSFTYWNLQTAEATKWQKRSGCLGNNFFTVSRSVLQLIFSFSQGEKYHCRRMLATNKKNALFLVVVKILVWLHWYERKYDLCFCKKPKSQAFKVRSHDMHGKHSDFVPDLHEHKVSYLHV